jgi:hypothetical protein
MTEPMPRHHLYASRGGRTRAQEDDTWRPARPATCSRPRCRSLAVVTEPRDLCHVHLDQVNAHRLQVLQEAQVGT